MVGGECHVDGGERQQRCSLLFETMVMKLSCDVPARLPSSLALADLRLGISVGGSVEWRPRLATTLRFFVPLFSRLSKQLEHSHVSRLARRTGRSKTSVQELEITDFGYANGIVFLQTRLPQIVDNLHSLSTDSVTHGQHCWHLSPSGQQAFCAARATAKD